MKYAVIYWSQTGNTQMMAQAIKEGMGDGAQLFEVQDITPEQAALFEYLALGCPAMGSETLEDDYFEPFIDKLYKNIDGKKVALFGSYGWGDGDYMQDWQERTMQSGAILFKGEGLIINETPDAAALKECKEFGAQFAKS